MAEFDDSTSPPALSRRALISGVAAVPLMEVDAGPGPGSNQSGDPVLLLWREWRGAHRAVATWCYEWQQIEKRLVRTLGFPGVLVPQPSAAEPIWATTVDDIDAALDGVPDADPLRASLHALLAEREARWRAAADAEGMEEAEAREIAAWETRKRVGEAIFAQSSGTLIGVAAKLVVILAIGESRPNDPEFPWPQIRSALSDLRGIGGIPAETLML